jgi:hypothetical protein
MPSIATKAERPRNKTPQKEILTAPEPGARSVTIYSCDRSSQQSSAVAGQIVNPIADAFAVAQRFQRRDNSGYRSAGL